MKTFGYLVILLIAVLSPVNILGNDMGNTTTQEVEQVLQENVFGKILLNSCNETSSPGRFYLKQDQTLPHGSPSYVYYEGSGIRYRIVQKIITNSDKERGVQWNGCAFILLKGPIRELYTNLSKPWSGYIDTNIQISFYIKKINGAWDIIEIPRSFKFIEFECSEVKDIQ